MLVIYGLTIGSFLNVVALRLPAGESIVYPPSRCPRCHTRLRSADLVPIFSWLFLRSKCRYCQASIHWQYPVVEAVTGILWGMVGWRYGWSGETVFGLVFVSFLVVLSVIDLHELILPDVLTYPLLGVALIARAFTGGHAWWNYLAGGALGAGILLLLAWLSPYLFGKEGMGLGDVKLMAGIGMAVGLAGSLVTLFIASFSGLLAGLFLRWTNQLREGGHLPFGPFLSLGAVIAYLWGDPLVQWYANLFV